MSPTKERCWKCGAKPWAMEWHRHVRFNCKRPGFSESSYIGDAVGDAVETRRDDHLHYFCRCGFDWTRGERRLRARAGDVTDLSHVSTEELTREIERRGALPRCRCQKWGTYFGPYDSDGYTQRCFGCLRAVAKCTCG